MTDEPKAATITRRELLEQFGAMAMVSVVAHPLGDALGLETRAEPLAASAGVDRVVMQQGRTYLNGWAGYGAPPRPGRAARPPAAGATPPPEPLPAPTVTWSKLNGPGVVTFADRKSAVTTARF